jgi:hypothetical protein
MTIAFGVRMNPIAFADAYRRSNVCIRPRDAEELTLILIRQVDRSRAAEHTFVLDAVTFLDVEQGSFRAAEFRQGALAALIVRNALSWIGKRIDARGLTFDCGSTGATRVLAVGSQRARSRVRIDDGCVSVGLLSRRGRI